MEGAFWVHKIDGIYGLCRFAQRWNFFHLLVADGYKRYGAVEVSIVLPGG